MLNAFRYYYYYQRSSSRIWPMVQDWAGATFAGLDFFMQVLATPEPGKYCLVDGAYVPQAEASDCDTSVDIPVGMGRHYTTGWTDEFFYRPEVIGHVWDKILAVMALTDSAAFFTKDFSSSFNRGAFSIGYYRVFGPEVTEYFTNFMKGNTLGYSGHVYVNDGVPSLVPPVLVQLDDVDPHADAPKIKASTSWGLRYYGTMYPLIRYTSTVDAQLDFGKRARIAYLGGAQDPTVSDDVEVRALFTPLPWFNTRPTAWAAMRTHRATSWFKRPTISSVRAGRGTRPTKRTRRRWLISKPVPAMPTKRLWTLQRRRWTFSPCCSRKRCTSSTWFDRCPKPWNTATRFRRRNAKSLGCAGAF